MKWKITYLDFNGNIKAKHIFILSMFNLLNDAQSQVGDYVQLEHIIKMEKVFEASTENTVDYTIQPK